MTALLHADDHGLHCPAGAFWIDPWRPVETAIVTHAHADHARPGMARYVCAAACEPLLRRRVGRAATIVGRPYGEPFRLGDVTVSLHPAGHCLGSAQVRVEAAGEVAVAAGDYKRTADPTCAAFELVPCDLFVTEATFGLPIYSWSPTETIVQQLLTWWDDCRVSGRTAILFCYALGKAQRVLAELRHAIAAREPALDLDTTRHDYVVRTHGALEPMLEAYRELGTPLLPTQRVGEDERVTAAHKPFRGALVMAPPSAAGSPWMRRFGAGGDYETGFASGWMRVRGIRRRRGYDRGFVISDHADWPDLLRTCEATGAQHVLCTHGYAETLARALTERALTRGAASFTADVLSTEYDAEDER